MTKRIFLLLLLVMLAASGCSKGGGKSNKLTIAVIPKGTTHEFWKSIHAGAIKAARELATPDTEISIIWKGPLREDDREHQIQVVEGFLSQGVSGIVLAPLDNRALVRPVEEAARASIPTVIIDSGLQSEAIVSFVATDNYKGGELGGERLGSLLGGKGKVLLLRYQEGSASTEEREAGFLARLKAVYPEIEVVSGDQYAGPTRETAYRASQNVLNRFGNRIQGVFCPNESSTAGMLLALQDINKLGKITFVGFDASQAFIDAMQRNHLQGVVLQNPFKMGYLGVKAMVDHLRGQKVDKRIDTGVSIVTPENLNEPKSQELLHPPIAEYVK